MNLKNKLFGMFEYCIGLQSENDKADFLMPSFRYWYADPMLRKINGKYYLFAEQFDKIKEKGMISVSEVIDGKIKKPKTIINEPFHMSFPNVFEYNNEFYMIPETVATGKIIIYKMMNDIYHWEIINSFDIPNCVDTAVYVDSDCIYLLTCEEHPTNKLYDRLRLLKIDNPYDKEIIDCTDVAIKDNEYSLNKRNGGNFIIRGKEIFRIVQKSTEDYYGKSIFINKIINIDSRLFEESFVEEKAIDDFIILTKTTNNGVHTYGVCDDNTVWDYSATFFSLKNLFRKVLGLIIKHQLLKKLFLAIHNISKKIILNHFCVREKLEGIEWFGSQYGGFYINTKIIRESSKPVVYSFGIGEDLSFSEDIISKFSNAFVYAFDPTPDSINFVNNHALSTNHRFSFLPVGVSDENEKKEFFTPLNQDNVSCSEYKHSKAKSTGLFVDFKTLDSIAQLNGHKNIDIIKMDIEGSEFKVFSNIFCKKIKVNQISFELHDRFFKFGLYKTYCLLRNMEKNNFKLVKISQNMETLLFVSKEINI